MKYSIKTVDLPLKMPKSVTKALSLIWVKDVPSNIRDICYTYGDTCFSANPLSMDVIAHESVHTDQQTKDGMTPDLWWKKVGEDKVFRYEQELEAYRKQYQYMKGIHGKIKAFSFAKMLAKDMSAPMYGNMCSYNQALVDITRE